MALKTKTHVALTSGTWASELESILVLRPLQPQARDGCLATHTAVARTTNRLARKVHAFPKVRDTGRRVNGVTRHIVDRSHLFFGCTGARFGYRRLFVLAVQSRYIHSAQLADSGCFGFRQIYMVKFVSSGIAYAGLMVSNGRTSSNDRCNLSNGNPIATTISPV